MSMIESLESRTLFSVNTSSVALFNASGRPTTIDRHKAAWFLVHGDNMNESQMTALATAVQDQLTPANQWQVLIVDWSKLATASNTATNATAVGDRVAAMITASRLPISRVNLIGFSSGGEAIDEIAKDLRTRSTQVNRIVGIDPFSKTANYAAESTYSIAFCGRDGEAGTSASLSCDDAVALTGLSGTSLQQHGQVFSTVTTIFKRDAGLISKGNDHVSAVFSIQHILAGSPLPWRHGIYFEGFEAQMACGYQRGLPEDFGPISLTYQNTRRHRQTVT